MRPHLTRPPNTQSQSESDATNQNDRKLPRRPVEVDANVAAAAVILRAKQGGGGGKGARRDRGGKQGSCRLIRALSLSLSLANHIVGATDLPLTWPASAWTCTWALAAVAVAAAADVDAGSVQDNSVINRLAQSAMRDPVAAIVGCQGLSSLLSCCCCSLRYSL